VWRYIDSGAGSAQWNMAVDEALLLSFEEKDLPILRLYRWEEPSLSFGRFSNPRETLDWEWVQEEELSCVRRMTGGGILVHGGDLSYTLVLSRHFVKERGVRESYRELCAFLIRLYHGFGLEVSFAYDLQVAPSHAAACLAGTEAYDIMIDGRKIGGNAQRYTHRALLQHGSIPLCIDRRYFETFFREPSGLNEAATLEEAGVGMRELQENLLESFGASFDTSFQSDGLSDEEFALAQKLYREKYAKESWSVDAKS